MAQKQHRVSGVFAVVAHDDAALRRVIIGSDECHVAGRKAGGDEPRLDGLGRLG